ncbi:sulfatase [Brachybacterium sp. ACRRE]|uniref:sulfatase family protein n=1 Tax=Brachybacterium sp. ACRRE TaxID=2918184 RepID=UPI001EF2DF1A|nr:sulfatase [Brachybacterium sp. ACRRE]MCG7311048.1 sulfatase [Brachybacterium sp. ACRRE]
MAQRPADRTDRRPNIVFIMSDDHAAHAISAYGAGLNSTPCLDRIAQEGVRMDDVFCTNSICTPSRASILTGTYSHVNGVATIYTEIDHRLPTFPEVLRDSGYATGLFGKWHLGLSEQSRPRGFDDWRIFPNQGEYRDPLMIGPTGEETVEGYATDLVTDMSLDWLGRVREERPEDPFCLLVHHKAPHRPWVPHERHRDLYPVGSIPEPETLFDDHEGRSEVIRDLHMTIADHLTEADIKEAVPEELRGEDARVERTRWKYQRYMRDYLQTVQAIDDGVGRVLDELDELGVADDTLVIYTSDQGFFLGDHGWYDKRLMFRESLRMPVLVRWPQRIPAGSTCEDIGTNVDFAATILDAAGIDARTAMPRQQGRSLLPVMGGETPSDWPQSMYYRYWEHLDVDHNAPAHYGVRTHDFLFVDYYGDGMGAPGSSDDRLTEELELYDLRADPAELHNVAHDPGYAEALARMQDELARLQEQYEDHPYTGPSTPRPDWGPALPRH